MCRSVQKTRRANPTTCAEAPSPPSPLPQSRARGEDETRRADAATLAKHIPALPPKRDVQKKVFYPFPYDRDQSDQHHLARRPRHARGARARCSSRRAHALVHRPVRLGKSTIAFTLEHALVQRGRLAYVLDGDNIRHGLNKNLGFSAADREENIRRIGEVAKLFADAGVITMTSFISPYRKDRDTVRALHDAGQAAVHRGPRQHADRDLRDSAIRRGCTRRPAPASSKDFTGIDDPYEAPPKPELTIDATSTSPQEATVLLMEYLAKAGLAEARSVACQAGQRSADGGGSAKVRPWQAADLLTLQPAQPGPARTGIFCDSKGSPRHPSFSLPATSPNRCSPTRKVEKRPILAQVADCRVDTFRP